METNGAGRNCSLATITASRPVALRKARRKRESALRERRRVLHLEKMMVQEKIEKRISIEITPIDSGDMLPSISSKLTCSRAKPAGVTVNSSPFPDSNIDAIWDGKVGSGGGGLRADEGVRP